MTSVDVVTVLGLMAENASPDAKAVLESAIKEIEALREAQALAVEVAHDLLADGSKWNVKACLEICRRAGVPVPMPERLTP